MNEYRDYSRPHRREDYCTRASTVDPDQNADCPLWKAFLLRIMGGNAKMVAYLQRVCGYCLTGLVGEHVMFFLHGSGANGKSTFAGVLLGILGTGPENYAAVAPISTFTASRNEQHPTDLAMLRGVRLVVAHETEEGRSWAVSKVKMMTGGDPITARFMRQNFFTYKPQFKIMVLGNHKPNLHNINEAIRRRIHLIPFDLTIPEAERDRELADKLKAEYGAILHWMIQGCAAWQEQGLNPPQQVLDATDRYLLDEDNVGAWVSEQCLVGETRYYSTLAELFPSWRDWAVANNEFVGTSKNLAKALDGRSELTRHNQPGTNRAGWDGIMLKLAGATP